MNRFGVKYDELKKFGSVEDYKDSKYAKNDLDDKIENGRGYNPNRDKSTGQFTFGAGGKVKAKKMKYSDFEDLADQATIEQAENPAWVLKQIYKKQGFNAKPQVVSDEVFQTVEGETQYRGIVEVRGNGELKQYFKTGASHYPGTGIYGNGTYVTTVPKVARAYSSSDSLLNMKFNPKAKSVDYRSVLEPAGTLSRKMEDKATKLLKSDDDDVRFKGIKQKYMSRVLADPGVYAASQGYDYMTIGNDLAQDPQSILFNRGMVVVNETNYRSTL